MDRQQPTTIPTEFVPLDQLIVDIRERQSESCVNFNPKCPSAAAGTIGDENDLNLSELKWKMAHFEAKLQTLEARNKHHEEVLKFLEEKQIQENKYAELEARMRDKASFNLRLFNFTLSHRFLATIIIIISTILVLCIIVLNVIQGLGQQQQSAENVNRSVELKGQIYDFKGGKNASEGKIYENELVKGDQLPAQMEELRDEFGKLLSIQIQHEQQQKEMAKLEALNRKYGEILDNVELQAKARLLMGQKLRNPTENNWNRTNTRAKISPNGLEANNTNNREWINVFAEKGFDISGQQFRLAHFFGTIVYYFEIIQTSWSPSDWAFHIGLSNGIKPEPDGTYFLDSPNTYAFERGDNYCLIDGGKYDFKWPEGAIKPTWNVKRPGDVVGCGLLLGAGKKLSIFFTANGILMGKQIPIDHPPMAGDLLFPTVLMWNISMEANFGDDKSKRFKYDTEKFPGLVIQ